MQPIYISRHQRSNCAVTSFDSFVLRSVTSFDGFVLRSVTSCDGFVLRPVTSFDSFVLRPVAVLHVGEKHHQRVQR